MSAIVSIFAGLGFIFIGTQFMTANLRQAVGPRFQALVERAIGHPFRSALVGVAAGAFIQSTNAVTFIVVGLVTAGAATVRQAMPIVTWSYCGSSMRLLLASVNIEIVILLGIALLGFAHLLGIDRQPRWRYLVAGLLGLFLLLYGVEFVARSAIALKDDAYLKVVLGIVRHFYPWGFIAGTLLASFIQGQTVSVIAIALAMGGVLTGDQTLAIVVGANLGSGIMSIVQGSSLLGYGRQLNLYQFLLKVIGAIVFIPLLTIEHYTALPLLGAWLAMLTSDVGLQVTALHWICQITSAVLATAFSRPIEALISRWCPPTSDDTLGRPLFLRNVLDAQPAVAVPLLEKELSRLLARLPHFIDGARDLSEVPEDIHEMSLLLKRPSREDLARAGEDVLRAVEATTRDALNKASGQEEQIRLLSIWNRGQTMRQMQAELLGLGLALLALKASSLSATASIIAESADAIFRAVIDELALGTAEGREISLQLVSDRMEALMQFRQDVYAKCQEDAPPKDFQLLWASVDSFERAVWLLRRYITN